MELIFNILTLPQREEKGVHIRDFSVPLPQDYVLRPARSRRNISYLVPLPPATFMFCPIPPAKACIKVIYIDFFSVHRRIYMKWFCNSSTTSQHKRSR